MSGRMDEVQRVAGSRRRDWRPRISALTAEGNVPRERDPHGDFVGKNILAQTRPLAETARLLGIEPQAASDRLASCLSRLLAARSARRRPHLDDKIVAGWNGLMISALARAAVVPAESLADRRPAYLAAALRAAEFAERELFNLPGGVPRRSWRRGSGSGPGFAEDCAFLVQAWLDLYEATLRPRLGQAGGDAPAGPGRAVLGLGRRAATSTPRPGRPMSSCA